MVFNKATMGRLLTGALTVGSSPGGKRGVGLIGATTVVLSACTTTVGSPTILTSTTTGVVVGMYITGPGIPLGAVVISVNAGVSVTMNFGATLTQSTNQTITFGQQNSSPTTQYSITAPNINLVTALWTAVNGGATIAANTTIDLPLPLFNVQIGDVIDANPQFAAAIGASWAISVQPASTCTAVANTTAYIAGQVVKATVNSVVNAFVCTVAGTTGTGVLAALASVTPGKQYVDGTVTWTNLGLNVAMLRLTNATTGTIATSGLSGMWTIPWTCFTP